MDTGSMIAVSNRLPYSLKRDADGALTRHSSAGGLVTALAPVIKSSQGMWIGWPGLHLKEDDIIPEGDPKSTNNAETIRNDQIRPVNIDSDLFDDYYNGFCNGTLWPLMHSLPERAIFNRDHWHTYEKVNGIFAAEAIEVLTGRMKDCPLVWVHDYQLMLVPNLIRQSRESEGVHVPRLAFFLHIPFPPWDIFRLLPWNDELLVGLLGCDLIGFHVDGYVDNFIECCYKGLGCRVDRDNGLVYHDNHLIRVQAFPIGIPFRRFEDLARKEHPDVKLPSSNLKLVLGVDRLDYTKGIVLRLKAFEVLLETYPEHLEKILLMQIAVPSRVKVEEYQELKDEIDREVGRINGRFSTSTWSPIRYIYRSMNQDELCAFYKSAFVALVTPVRDGMNLVAKEYVACQIQEPGVLILSPFTGAGETMHEAIIANPLEEHSLAKAIHHALTMPLDERELRMSALRHRERKRDIDQWVQTFLDATGAYREQPRSSFEPLGIHHFEKWLAKYVDTGREKLALLLDFDGTLAPIVARPELAKLPDETKQLLEDLSQIPDVHLAIISGRALDDVRKKVDIKDITYSGNHGLETVTADGIGFVHPDVLQFTKLMGELKDELYALDVLKSSTDGEQTDGQEAEEKAWVEEKQFSMTVHYRQVPVEKHPIIIKQSTDVIRKYGFWPKEAKCAVEARPPIKWDKGRASIHILRNMFGIDWSERARVIFVGDDETDEDAMTALKGMAVTFRIANSSIQKTSATHRLPDTGSVVTLLKWAKQHMEKCAAAK